MDKELLKAAIIALETLDSLVGSDVVPAFEVRQARRALRAAIIHATGRLP